MERGENGMNTKITTVLGDITKIEYVDAVVNAANSSLLGGGGVDGAIHRAAGRELLAECMKLHGCKTGQAKFTRGYKMNCKYIIHTVGPVWFGGKRNEEKMLAECYYNCCKLAREQGVETMAFPSISTGAYRFPIEQAAEIAVKTVWDFIHQEEHAFREIKWVLFDEKTKAVFDRVIRERTEQEET